LARTIERALQRICAFIERERYFTSSASHELRTPLTVISGALDLLERPGLSENASRVVGRIRRATVEMQATIEMFLSLSRETADSSRREHFEVAPLIEQAIERQRHLLADKQIDIDVVRSADPCLFGDPQAFAVAVSNLVRNAFEHTPHDKGPVEVRIGEYQVSVSNHSGLDADDAVELSTQLSRRGVSQGFGLGLGIVQRLCENNGWTFTLNVNQGAVDARLAWAASGSRAAVK
jgi:signal transduction histidine kinase